MSLEGGIVAGLSTHMHFPGLWLPDSDALKEQHPREMDNSFSNIESSCQQDDWTPLPCSHADVVATIEAPNLKGANSKPHASAQGSSSKEILRNWPVLHYHGLEAGLLADIRDILGPSMKLDNDLCCSWVDMYEQRGSTELVFHDLVLQNNFWYLIHLSANRELLVELIQACKYAECRHITEVGLQREEM